MLILLVINKLLQSLILCISHWLTAPSRLLHGYKHPHPIDRHDHRHSTKKPEWLKAEIIRLKALMPQAGSRALLHLQVLHNKTSRTLLACLLEVIHTHGKPKIIRTDNEAIFTSRNFRLGLKQLGIRHQRTDPGCPWQNGRIERLFGTLKQKLDQWQVPDIAQLNRDLQTFRHWYNHIRPHQNLSGKTPAEAWRGIDPYTKSPKEERWFEAWDRLLMGYDLRR